MNVGRISINPQTFNDKTLKIIGRSHTALDTEEKFYLAREMGFSHINTDIIAGALRRKISVTLKNARKILALNPESVTVHTLCVKARCISCRKVRLF
ncbi:MAG: hypothetical protein L6V93_07820 [Clostridiales bacterium]|nr:MAG: hypothetical protein L6V93_07820 [Clostridiales bacterium]